MIVIEGMDNSGKSTLGEMMAYHYGMFVQESEGPPKDAREINQRIDRYEKRADRYIFVRHPCISNPIYAKFRAEGDLVTVGRTVRFYQLKPLIIYCDAGTRGLDDHVVKDHDSEKHLADITQNYQELLSLYRQWAAERAHFVYRIGDNMKALVHTVNFYRHYLSV